MAVELEKVVSTPATLGEGPCWHAKENVLYWIDILEKSLHRFDPASQTDTQWPLEQMVGTVAPCQDGQMLLALQNGFAKFDPATGQIAHWPAVDDSHQTRFNDGKCDPAGRFWCGTMDLQEQSPLGTLYRTDTNGQTTAIIQNVTISNGIAWSPDRSTMYYIDSPTRQVVAYDFDLASGDLSNCRVVIELTGDEGFPDGMTIDEEGMIWLAHWAGSRVCRWDPNKAEVLQRHEVPAPHTSACCFGGDDLSDLYITTARKGLTEEQLDRFPESGCLFRLKTNVRGCPTFVYG